MKKIISFILGVAIILQGIAVVSAEEKLDNREITEAITLIEYLEIIDVASGSDNSVTRADFATYVARVLNFDEYSGADKTYYNDIPTTHWAAASINTLVERGVLTVGEDRMFRPTDEITVQEGVKILLSIMGYKPSAELIGAFPSGYMEVALRLKMLDNVPQTGTLTRKTSAVLLSNAMNTDMCEAMPDGNGLKYTQVEGKNLLSMYKDMYSIEGRVDAVNGTALYSGDELHNGIMIDGAVYDFNGETSYIGLEVMAYYKQSSGDDAEVVLVFDRSNEDDVIDITADCFEEFTGDYELYYYKTAEANKLSSVRVKKNAAVIYNSVAVDTDIVNLVNISEGSIRVIRSKGSNVYDIVIVREAEPFVVGYVNASTGVVYDLVDGNNTVNLSEEWGTVKIYDSNANPVSFSSIKKNTVLTVYRSLGNFVEVYISSDEVSGEYTGEYEKDGKKYFYIDGELHRVSDKYYSNIKKRLTIGQEVNFKVDMFGTIATISTMPTDTEFSYGYYINHTLVNDAEEEVYVRLYSAEDGVKKYKAAEKVRIDGERKKTQIEIDAKLTDSIDRTNTIYKTFTNRPTSVTSRVIRFKINEDGEISDIDTPYRGNRESEDTLKIVSAGSNVDYIWTGIIGYTTIFDSNTVLLQVPSDAEIAQADDKMFYSGGMKSLGSNVNVIGYNSSVDNGACDIVVHISTVDNSPRVANNIMVDHFITAIDEYDEPIEYLIGWNAGNEKRYVVNADVKDGSGRKIKMSESGIENGDIVLMAFNSRGEVEQYTLIYDHSEDKTYPLEGKSIFPKDYYGTDDYKAYYNKGDRLSHGYARSLLNGVLALSYTKGGDNRELYPVKNISVTVHDSSLKKNNIYKGTMEDVVTYEEAGYHCSTIIAHSQYVEWKSYYVYK